MTQPIIRINEHFYQAIILLDGRCIVRRYDSKKLSNSDAEHIFTEREVAAILCHKAHQENGWA